MNDFILNFFFLGRDENSFLCNLLFEERTRMR